MKIKIKLTGFLSSQGLSGDLKAGIVEVPNNSTIDDLLKIVGVDPSFPWIMARNGKQIQLTDQLEEGDTIKFIPPVSGG